MKRKLFNILYALSGIGNRRGRTAFTFCEHGVVPLKAENSYDKQGRLVKTLRSDGSYIIYEYTSSAALLKLYSEAGDFLYSYHYEFNKDGLCNRITRSDKPQYEELTQYNADKTIARKITCFQGLTRVLAYNRSSSIQESYTF